jgi:hypothetical protein
MIPKEIMKRGGILSRLAQFKEESPYKPEILSLCVRLSLIPFLAPKFALKKERIKIKFHKSL